MVGSLPSRALGMMVFIGQHLATPDVASLSFVIGSRTSRLVTSADVGRKSTICQLYSANFCQITSFRPSKARGEISAEATMGSLFQIMSSRAKSKDRPERYIVNVLCPIVSLREATIFVAPCQSPERVPSERDAPTTKRAPKCGGWCMGSCRGIANMGTADASRRFAH